MVLGAEFSEVSFCQAILSLKLLYNGMHVTLNHLSGKNQRNNTSSKTSNDDPKAPGGDPKVTSDEPKTPRDKPKKPDDPKTHIDKPQKPELNDEQYKEDLNWLESRIHPWELAVQKWAATANRRLHDFETSESTIDEYIEKFPILSSANASQLVFCHKRPLKRDIGLRVPNMGKGEKGLNAFTQESIKQKQNSLRTHFLSELKKIEASKRSGTGTDSLYYPTMTYFDDLLFLQDHVKLRPTVSNAPKDKEPDDNIISSYVDYLRHD
ncbi:unnamed protein product [Bemisia tabaci]|uniref:Uncharacterized protein n=1 Tax=Bemisia tabaci TaxID=7038 RepID=A0A9P0A2U4_BEMTA|nr:unnamed protein product [Bemisia tabaci]